MRNKNGNKVKRNTEEGSAMENLRKVKFTGEEKSRGLHVIDLEEKGQFRAEYVVPQNHEIFGYWHLSDKAYKEITDQGFIIENPEQPQWAVIRYSVVESQKGIENFYIKYEDVQAHKFLRLHWDLYEVNIYNENEESYRRRIEEIVDEVLELVNVEVNY